ncbi:hypothetical protein LWI29_017611 [Acer saccharum]|uniref:Uncharacterized protein n=1 Tax=Acer saccharum TaxID=4024 RepID=A0AA39VRE2_ACESA|nr:hypothetical protein LWI29_017611 [Acer saccharum]
MEELDEVSIDPDQPDRKVFIGSRLPDDIRKQLVEFLRERRNSFAWSHEDMIGIDPEVMVHRLQVDPDHQPVKQKRRKFAPERNKVINEEIQKLFDIGSVKEVKYPDWLANVVVVKKKNGKWRVCIDFTDLNKACPKDSFPLPHIDMLVDATAGHELLSFMDAYSGYNQILMHPDDQEKTAFVTERGIFCYKVMPFGLKNAGATYQRLVNKMFAKMLGSTMEVYIDDMLVKSLVAQQHIDHLRQSFDVLDQYGMKLNPTKCSFGVSSGKFLGYLVTQRGVEANPDQIRSIENIESPKCMKDVQKLTGRVAALNRFISKSSEKCLPFFNILRKNKAFEWNDDCEKALQDLKTYLRSPPLLSKPKDNEILFIYLAVSNTAVSAVLVREEESVQHPVYYVSKTLLDAETRYSRLEKLALALVMAARKLRPYFQCHSIKVLTAYPLKNILHKPELSGRLTKWAVELSEYDISFHPRSAMKSQVLADFIADFTPGESVQAEQELVALTITTGIWTLSVDGSSSIKGSGLGLVLESPHGDILEQSIHCGFHATNNEAEYEALIAGLDLAKSLSVKIIKVRSDSQLVVRQVNGTYEARDQRMSAYLNKVKKLQSPFDEFSIEQIPRSENTRADALANLGSTTTNSSKSVPIIHLMSPSIQESETVAPVDNGRSWIEPIFNYLQADILPGDRTEARRIKAKAAKFCILYDKLYKKSFTGPYLRCVTPREAYDILKSLHQEECGNHSGARSLSNRAITAGYYWPTMRVDSQNHVKACDKCQRFAPMSHLPPGMLNSISAPWPFMKWGMDIVGKLPAAPGGVVYMLVLTDYFTKWVEVGAYQQVRDIEVRDFIWKNIICRFGVPKEIVTDNGSQFISFDFRNFCDKYAIKLSFSTPRYPQANGQAESTNKTIVNTLKKRLEAEKSQWAEKLPEILWSYRTTPRRSTGETPFSLVYGSEAVIPIETRLPTARSENPNEEQNNLELSFELDHLDERRDRAALRTQSYQQQVARHYNKKVNIRIFKLHDWVLRRVFQNTREEGAGKLGPTWEGPYQVTDIVGRGAYKLRGLDGRELHNSWNAIHLKQYHF